ncbi:CsbD family protein [Methyloversatilis sp.]|uniref:CsbD family protein n=1 Tax=Methyloversatilis sp. TaxID=2569862 RepID=UPI002733896E|nr:CsbD family protein [Methyloversatilis sp.]MDP2868428.1 CsbD family protein [Methyloversatilis sp.]MDP3454698.1 CsbD family protein [Methyloversatilis sp.]MDP3579306.1 CsbD family protein [Methyloversatilis sp.]
MNWDIAEGNWKQFKGKVKSQWGKLTDDQLDVIAGKRIELAGRIQEAYGITKDEAESQIEQFEKLNEDSIRTPDRLP